MVPSGLQNHQTTINRELLYDTPRKNQESSSPKPMLHHHQNHAKKAVVLHLDFRLPNSVIVQIHAPRQLTSWPLLLTFDLDKTLFLDIFGKQSIIAIQRTSFLFHYFAVFFANPTCTLPCFISLFS